MDESEIGWTDGTKNFWAGCTKISEGCKNCYASKRTGELKFVEWGPKAKRRIIQTVEAQARKAERQAVVEGRMLKQFVNSWSDFFEDRPEVVDARNRAYRLIGETPHLIWILLTKRPQNIEKLIPEDWKKNGWPSNVWLGVTAENQKRADERIPILLQHQAVVRFVSAEPLLGPLDLSAYIHAIDWVIVGGESGDLKKQDIRPVQVEWARGVRDQCVTASVPFFFKQWGNHEPGANGGLVQLRVKRKGSAKLDGQVWEQFPEVEAPRTQAPTPTETEPDAAPGPTPDSDATSEGPQEGPPSAGASPPNVQASEAELAGLLGQLTRDMSKFARIRLNGRAKAIYESLHPETKHGGNRQVPRNGTWPSYVNYAAAKSGFAPSTIYNDVEADEKLADLDPKAEKAVYGGPLANRPSFLCRIARIPEQAIHRDLVQIYNTGQGPRKAAEELEKWEEHFHLDEPDADESPPDSGDSDTDDDAGDDEPESGNDDVGDAAASDDDVAAAGDGDGAPAPDQDATEDLANIYQALGVTSTAEALTKITGLHQETQTLHGEVGRLRKQAEKLQQERDMLLQGGPIAELLKLLNVPTTKKAVDAVKALKDAARAA